MGLPQHHVSAPDHDPLDAFDLAPSVSPCVTEADWRQPKGRDPTVRPHVDVWWFERPAVLVRIEEEPIWPEPMDGRHACLADRRGGVASMTVEPYLVVNP
jgi:hypothetical protein